jgi:hypothetical protein
LHTSNIKHVVTFALVTLATTITLPSTASAQNRLNKLEQDARGVLNAERQMRLDQQRMRLDNEERFLNRRKANNDAERGDARAVLKDVENARNADSRLGQDFRKTRSDRGDLTNAQDQLKQDGSSRSSRR